MRPALVGEGLMCFRDAMYTMQHITRLWIHKSHFVLQLSWSWTRIVLGLVEYRQPENVVLWVVISCRYIKSIFRRQVSIYFFFPSTNRLGVTFSKIRVRIRRSFFRTFLVLLSRFFLYLAAFERNTRNRMV